MTDAVGKRLYRWEESAVQGNYQRSLDLRDMPSGMYFLRLEIDGKQVVRRLMR